MPGYATFAETQTLTAHASMFSAGWTASDKPDTRSRLPSAFDHGDSNRGSHNADVALPMQGWHRQRNRPRLCHSPDREPMTNNRVMSTVTVAPDSDPCVFC